MRKKLLFSFLVLAFPASVFATHIVGGSLTYEHLGGSTYRVTQKLYRDCAPGNASFPGSITIQVRQPNGTAFTPSRNITIAFPGANPVPPNIPTCVTNPGLCLQEAVYTAVVNNLPPNPGGYHLYYQYCCRNASLSNVQNPLSTGESWYTYIPDNNLWLTNSSPSWANFPPVFVCQGQNLNFDHSATDLDGDSLVYSLYTPHDDPAPTFPGNVCTFTPITWVGGYGPTNALGGPPGSLTISQTGLLNGVPPNIGQFVVGIKCEEYRNGTKIGEILRDFQFNVVNCPPLAVANFTYSGACTSSTVTFTNTTTPAANSYFWDFGDASTSFLQNPPPHTYTGTGPYTVMLIVNFGTPCADTVTQQVYIASATAAFTATGPTCAGDTVFFTDGSTASGNNSITGWNWDFGDMSSSGLQNPPHVYATGGTYNVTLIVNSALGCNDTVTQQVVIQGRPIANAGTDTFACTNNPTMNLGGTILNATGGTWIGAGTFVPNNTTLNATYTPTAGEIAAGFANLCLVSTGNGVCSADTDCVVITYVPGPTANAGPDIYVCKDTASVPLNGVVGLPATGGTWTTSGTGTFSPNPNTLNGFYIPSTADTTAGSVTLVLTTTGNGNCNPSTDTVMIFFTPTPTVQLDPVDTACASAPIPLNAIVSTGSGIWTSSGTGAFAPSNTTLNPSYIPSAADDAAGQVMLVFTSTNNGGCQAVSDTLFITLIPSPIAAFTNTTVCPWDTTWFNDVSTTTAGSIVSWFWNFGDPGSGANNFSNLQGPGHIYDTSGVFLVNLAVTSTNGCVDTVQQTITVYHQPVADFGDLGGCLNAGTTFMDSSTVNGGTITGWSWNFGDNGTSASQNPTHMYSAPGNYNVTLIVTSNQGCMDTITLPTTVFPNPLANFSADDFTPNIGQTVNFTDQSVTNIVSWSWDFGDPASGANNTSTSQNPSHQYTLGGIYTVVLIVTDANGCLDTVDYEVIVSLPPNVPTGFTPGNGDGQNDILFVLGGPFRELEFRIYNNWGELIFISNSQNVGWDGTKDGKDQPMGVYIWTVKGVTEDNVEHQLSGDVTLIR